MYLLIILLPFFGFCSAGLFGRYLGFYGSSIITTMCTFLSFLFSFVGFCEVGFLNCSVYFKLIGWFECGTLNVDWGFLFDSLTVSMCVLVTCISGLVHLYSTSYMSHDPHQPRFMSYLSLFTFFMLMLVTSDNFLQLFLNWIFIRMDLYSYYLLDPDQPSEKLLDRLRLPHRFHPPPRRRPRPRPLTSPCRLVSSKTSSKTSYNSLSSFFSSFNQCFGSA